MNTKTILDLTPDQQIAAMRHAMQLGRDLGLTQMIPALNEPALVDGLRANGKPLDARFPEQYFDGLRQAGPYFLTQWDYTTARTELLEAAVNDGAFWAAREAASQNAATRAASAQKSAQTRADAKAAVEALLDRAFECAKTGVIPESLQSEIEGAKLLVAQTKRWNGIQALAPRAAAENQARREQEAQWAIEREAARAAQQAAYQAQQAQWAAQRAAKQAQLDATRVRMALNDVPKIGATFWISEDNTRARVCTGYSKQPWQLSQDQIDDNDDFELEGVWLTYVYFEEHTISMHDALELRLARRDAEAKIESDEVAARAESAQFEALKTQAMTGTHETTDARPDVSGYETLFDDGQDHRRYGHYIGRNADELIYIEKRPLVGDWMDCQKIYTIYRAPLAR